MRNVLTLVLIVLSAALYGQMGSKNFIDQNFIEVKGKAEIEVTPNEIYLQIFITEADTKNKVTVTDLENKMADKLKDLGIDVSIDLVIKDMGSNFKSHFLQKKAILLSKEYQLKVSTGKMAAQVFIELEKLGISNISIDKLDHTELEKFKTEAKTDAIIAAKAKAELLSGAIGQSVGRAIFISEQNFNRRNNTSNTVYIRGMSSMASSEPLDVDFEKIKIEYTVLVRFELK